MSEPRVHLIDDEDSVRNAMSFILDMADLPSRSQRARVSRCRWIDP